MFGKIYASPHLFSPKIAIALEKCNQLEICLEDVLNIAFMYLKCDMEFIKIRIFKTWIGWCLCPLAICRTRRDGEIPMLDARINIVVRWKVVVTKGRDLSRKGPFTRCDSSSNRTVSHLNILIYIHVTHSEIKSWVTVVPCEHSHRGPIYLLGSVGIAVVIVAPCEWALSYAQQRLIWREDHCYILTLWDCRELEGNVRWIDCSKTQLLGWIELFINVTK